VAKMGSLGFFGCLIPEEYGANGLGFLAHALISEEIARVMIHVAYSTLFSQTTLTNLLL
jgi:glutaryl-CoA dehydrogenase (non-decarboxylating)